MKYRVEFSDSAPDGVDAYLTFNGVRYNYMIDRSLYYSLIKEQKQQEGGSVDKRRDHYDFETSWTVLGGERITTVQTPYAMYDLIRAQAELLDGVIQEIARAGNRILYNMEYHNEYNQLSDFGPPYLVIEPMGDHDRIISAKYAHTPTNPINPVYYTPAGLWADTQSLYLFREDPLGLCHK